MKIDIEEYKGQKIQYDDESDKFVCDISIEDNARKTKRGSLNDLRKEIDVFVKENLNFKPFKALLKSSWGDSGFKEVMVTGIRTDKQLIVQEGDYKSFFDKKKAANLMKYDPDLIKEEEKNLHARELAVELHRSKLKSLSEKLVPIDLSKYELE